MNTEITTIEQAGQLTKTESIKFFSRAENLKPLIEMVRNEAKSSVPILTTVKGRDEIGSIALKVSKSRKALEQAMDLAVADLKAKVKAVTDSKKSMIADLNDLRGEILAPRAEWQAEQDKIEAARIEKIQEKIQSIHAMGCCSEAETKDSLSRLIEALGNIDTTNGFYEFSNDAVIAVKAATESVNNIIIKKIKDEQAQKEKEAAELALAKAKITERLSNIAKIPLSMLGKTEREIIKKINRIEDYPLLDCEFGDQLSDAKSAVKTALDQLELMRAQAEAVEAANKRAADEAAKSAEAELAAKKLAEKAVDAEKAACAESAEAEKEEIKYEDKSPETACDERGAGVGFNCDDDKGESEAILTPARSRFVACKECGEKDHALGLDGSIQCTGCGETGVMAWGAA